MAVGHHQTKDPTRVVPFDPDRPNPLDQLGEPIGGDGVHLLPVTLLARSQPLQGCCGVSASHGHSVRALEVVRLA